MYKRCCFAGHSKVSDVDGIYAHLLQLVEKLIVEEGVVEFWVGDSGNFDQLSAKAVRTLKETYPNIRLNLVIPHLTSDINEYPDTYHKKYDHVLIADIPKKTPKRFQAFKCNKYMVKRSDFLICYVEYSWGVAAKTAAYARRKKHIQTWYLSKNEA